MAKLNDDCLYIVEGYIRNIKTLCHFYSANKKLKSFKNKKLFNTIKKYIKLFTDNHIISRQHSGFVLTNFLYKEYEKQVNQELKYIKYNKTYDNIKIMICYKLKFLDEIADVLKLKQDMYNPKQTILIYEYLIIQNNKFKFLLYPKLTSKKLSIKMM